MIRRKALALVVLLSALVPPVLGGAEPAARIGDWTLNMEDVDKAIAAQAFELKQKMHMLRLQKIQELVSNRLVELEAKARNITPEELIRTEVVQKMPKVDDEAVKKLIAEKKDQLPNGGAGMEGQVREFMEMKGREQAEADFLEELLKKHKAEILVKPLTPPRFEVPGPMEPVRGKADAPVTIIEFSDFECPYCRRAHETLRKLEESHGGKFKMVYRHFPLQFHKQAQKAAEASQCADDQKKFWEFHDLIFANPQRMSADEFKKMARELKLDGDKFDACLDGGAHAKRVLLDQQIGAELGVSGTPTFFVNGLRLVGAVPLEQLQSVVLEEIARAEGKGKGKKKE